MTGADMVSPVPPSALASQTQGSWISTATGTYRGPYLTQDVSLQGSGTLGPFGDVTISANLSPYWELIPIGGGPTSFGQSLILSSASGSVDLLLQGDVVNFAQPPFDFQGQFSVLSGTGKYAGWETRGTFDLHFDPAQPPPPFRPGIDIGTPPFTGNFQLTISGVAPAFTSGTTASWKEGAAGPIYTAAASDPGGNTLSYSLTSNPNNALAIDANTGAVTVAHPNLLSPGNYTFAVGASSVEV
jgi:hypothetical protein